MPSQLKGIIYASGLGISLGAIGVFIMGYVAAIAIPAELILWFGNNTLASISINFVSQFLAFGVLAIIIGIILGRLSKKWLLNSTACYIGFIFYTTIGLALIYQTQISNPYAGFTSYLYIPSIILTPLCLIGSTWLTAKKRQQSQ